MNIALNKFILLFSFCVITNSSAENLSSLKNISVTDKGNTINISQLMPDEYWTLIILNKNLYNSHQVLDNLQNEKIDLSKTVILMIDHQHSNTTIDTAANKSTQLEFLNYQKHLNPYRWINVEGSEILDQLEISGTPIVLGMKTDDIIWQISGLSHKENFKVISSRINKWNGR